LIRPFESPMPILLSFQVGPYCNAPIQGILKAAGLFDRLGPPVFHSAFSVKVVPAHIANDDGGEFLPFQMG